MPPQPSTVGANDGRGGGGRGGGGLGGGFYDDGDVQLSYGFGNFGNVVGDDGVGNMRKPTGGGGGGGGVQGHGGARVGGGGGGGARGQAPGVNDFFLMTNQFKYDG